jgi:hypothetical protein
LFEIPLDLKTLDTLFILWLPPSEDQLDFLIADNLFVLSFCSPKQPRLKQKQRVSRDKLWDRPKDKLDDNITRFMLEDSESLFVSNKLHFLSPTD